MKQQRAVILLGILMANMWNVVMYAPAMTYRRLIDIEDERADAAREAQRKSVDSLEGADKASYNWIKKFAEKIATYLHKQGVTAVGFGDISAAYFALQNQQLENLSFIDESSKKYLEGAVQAYLDNFGKLEKSEDGSTWIQNNGDALVIYFESMGTDSVTFNDIQEACRKLGISMLSTKRASVKQRLVDYVNSRLNRGDGLLQEDAKQLDAVLDRLKEEGARHVSMQRFINVAEDMNMPKAFIARLKSLTSSDQNMLLEELHKELDKHNRHRDAAKVDVAKIVDVMTVLQKEETQSLARAVEVLRLLDLQENE